MGVWSGPQQDSCKELHFRVKKTTTEKKYLETWTCVTHQGHILLRIALRLAPACLLEPTTDPNPIPDSDAILNPITTPIAQVLLRYIDSDPSATTNTHGSNELRIKRMRAGTLLRNGDPYSHGPHVYDARLTANTMMMTPNVTKRGTTN